MVSRFLPLLACRIGATHEPKLTTLDDVASKFISTRPIEQAVGSAEAFERASDWIHDCIGQPLVNSGHVRCSKPNFTFNPTRLVEISNVGNTYNLRLRDMGRSDGVPYAALSYCWGGDQQIKLLRSLIPERQVSMPWEGLSKTIQDAIIVCARLSIRYLWVDALCIIQDDVQDKFREIPKMARIYSNAIFTIAASSAGSAQDGFLQDRMKGDDRIQAFNLPYVCGKGILGSVTLARVEEKDEPLDQRGWALQERILSPRTLEFGTRQTRWICQNFPNGPKDGWREWPENTPSRLDLSDLRAFQVEVGALDKSDWRRYLNWRSSRLRFYNSGDTNSTASPRQRINDFYRELEEANGGQVTNDWRSNLLRRVRNLQPHSRHQTADIEKGIQEWHDVVTTYTHRHLTDSRDRILAISGIAERYGRVFQDQYFAGLWMRSLCLSLSWYVESSDRQLAPQQYQGPSWSWVAINSPVRFSPGITVDGKSPELLSYDRALTDPTNPYGTVQKGICRLVLKGRTLPGFLSTADGETVVNLFPMNDRGCLTSAKAKLDALDQLDPDPKMNLPLVTLLEFSRKCGERGWVCSGLILKWSGMGTFKRVGRFEVNAGIEDRSNNETKEDWLARVDRDFDWFRHCSPRVITIM